MLYATLQGGGIMNQICAANCARVICNPIVLPPLAVSDELTQLTPKRGNLEVSFSTSILPPHIIANFVSINYVSRAAWG